MNYLIAAASLIGVLGFIIAFSAFFFRIHHIKQIFPSTADIFRYLFFALLSIGLLFWIAKAGPQDNVFSVFINNFTTSLFSGTLGAILGSIGVVLTSLTFFLVLLVFILYSNILTL